MFGTFWKISVRNVLKHKTYSAINIPGLALGFSAFIIISRELSWDKSNEKYARIYRIQRCSGFFNKPNAQTDYI
jgi:putative ABC transport system permease protein